MVKRQTKKAKGIAKDKVLDVDSPSKIDAFEKLLKSGRITIVLVYADWCGHCHTFKKNIWSPMCNKNAIHNRAALNEKVMDQTSLAKAKIPGYPSVLVVDENGRAQEFKTPEGTVTNTIPTPRTIEDMTRIVNVKLDQASPSPPPNTLMKEMKELPFMQPIEEKTKTPPLLGPSTPATSATPNGTTYEPTPIVAPKQQGGNMFEMMKGGALPMTVLKALNAVMMGGKRSRRKTQKRRRMIKA